MAELQQDWEGQRTFSERSIVTLAVLTTQSLSPMQKAARIIAYVVLVIATLWGGLSVVGLNNMRDSLSKSVQAADEMRGKLNGQIQNFKDMAKGADAAMQKKVDEEVKKLEGAIADIDKAVGNTGVAAIALMALATVLALASFVLLLKQHQFFLPVVGAAMVLTGLAYAFCPEQAKGRFVSGPNSRPLLIIMLVMLAIGAALGWFGSRKRAAA